MFHTGLVKGYDL